MKKWMLNMLVTAAVALALICTRSCANTTTPPSGGPKDTIPPLLKELIPVYNATNHPRDVKHSSISFEFNEYVVLKDPGKNIFLSPPQVKPPKAKVKGKKVVVSFNDPLDSCTTYSLSLGESVRDNNEGNIFPPFTYSFSTGSHVDSLFVSGTVQEAATMLTKPGITILFHTDPSDSAVFKVRPAAAAKSDIWGYFAVRNLKAGVSYRVFAIEDLNNNNLYDPDLEEIAFVDTLVVPHKVMHYDAPEIVARDLKDTLECLSRPSQLFLSMFKEKNTRQFIRNKGRLSRRQMYITFAAPEPKIDSIYVAGISHDKLLFEYNFDRDSVNIWIDDRGKVADTLRLMVDYQKTDDSLKVLVPASDTIRMVIPKPKYEKDRRGRLVEKIDTVARYDVEAIAENVDMNGIILTFKTPLSLSPFDSITFTSVDTRQQKKKENFRVERDSLDLKRFVLRPEKKLKDGFEYELKIPGRTFCDINGFYCDSLQTRLSLPKDENLSSLTLELSNVEERYLVELTDEKRKKVFRKYEVDSTSSLLFPYLKKGRYSVRITQDKNGNGRIDTGSLLERIQPEKVMMYKADPSLLGSDAYIMTIPERMDLVQTIDLAEMFR